MDIRFPPWRLVANTAAGGERLRQGLVRLAQHYPWIREIRGAGLFWGVDLTGHPESGLSGKQLAARVVNDLRRRGVLVGTTGRDSNVLKIRPPLVIGRAEVDFLLAALGEALGER
jgi:4-aminobutyrate aminotransferase-like enzyme